MKDAIKSCEHSDLGSVCLLETFFAEVWKSIVFFGKFSINIFLRQFQSTDYKNRIVCYCLDMEVIQIDLDEKELDVNQNVHEKIHVVHRMLLKTTSVITSHLKTKTVTLNEIGGQIFSVPSTFCFTKFWPEQLRWNEFLFKKAICFHHLKSIKSLNIQFLLFCASFSFVPPPQITGCILFSTPPRRTFLVFT